MGMIMRISGIIRKGTGRFLTVDQGPPLLSNPSSWNRYAYTWGDPINLNDPDGRLPANIGFEGGFGCVPTGFFSSSGVDASNACPPGMVVSYNRGSSGSQSLLYQIFEAFDGTAGIIDNWEYSGSSGRLYTVTISEAQLQYIQYLQSDACGCNSVDWSRILINISILQSGTTVTIGLAGIQLLNYFFKKDKPIGKPKDGLPTGTKGINEAGLTKDEVHAVKTGIGAKAADWVGIDTEDNVWTGTREGVAENHGPWRTYVP
jgi:hypothetical protein